MADQKQISVQVGGDVKGELIVAGGNVTVDRRTIYAGQPPSAQERADARNRLVLLEKVNAFWVQSVLEQSLHGMARIELGLEERPDSVEHPWEMMLQTLDGQPQSIAPGTSMIDLFDSMTQAMLILGEPGSGKTTMLLDLTRSLIARTRDNVDSPIPVVFTLSAWADKRLPLVEWLIDELNAKYLVPKETGREWLKQQSLGLMLDGLDEVRLEVRDDCVAAINAFRGEYGLTPICVSSRTAEYEMLSKPLNVEGAVIAGTQAPVKDSKGVQLKLEGALLLKPLTDDQIGEYIRRAGPELTGLHTLMEQDAALRELAHSPLMLSIMMVAYRGIPADQLAAGSIEDHRKHLFDAYIARMFKRRAGKSTTPPEAMTKHLAWLAQKMQQSGQTMLLIENIQPSWLRTDGQRRAYEWVQRLIGFPLLVLPFIVLGTLASFGAVLSFFINYAVGISDMLIGDFTSPAYIFSGFLILAGMSVVFGLAAAIIVSLVVGKTADQPIQVIESLRWSPGWSWQAAAGGLLTPILGSVLISVLWSLGSLVRNIGSAPTALFHLGAGMLPAMTVGALSGVLAAIIFGMLFGGLKSTTVSTSTRPNEGIRLSLRNALLMGLGVAGAITVLALWIEVAALRADFARSLEAMSQIALGLIAVITVGMVTGYLISVVYGGAAVVQHYALRGVLAHQKLMPFRIAPLLDEAANLILLRKVGGGYLFVHRLLMEHLAGGSHAASTPLTATERPAAISLVRFVRPALMVVMLGLTLWMALLGEQIWSALALVMALGLSGLSQRLTEQRVLIGGAAVIAAAVLFLAAWLLFFDGRNWLRGHNFSESLDSVTWVDNDTVAASAYIEGGLINASDGSIREVNGASHPEFVALTANQLSPDGSKVAWSGFTDMSLMQVSDMQTGEALFMTQGSQFVHPTWSPDSQWLAGMLAYDDPDLANPSAITILDGETGEVARTLPIGDGYVSALAWSPDGQRIAVVAVPEQDPARMITVDVETGEALTEFEAVDPLNTNDAPIWFADQSRIAALNEDRTRVFIWDAASGNLLTTLDVGQANTAYALDVSPNGQHAALGMGSGEVLIWEIEAGRVVDTLRGHTLLIRHLAWSPDGSRLFSADTNGRYVFWDVAQELANNP